MQEVVCRYRMHPDSMSQTVALAMHQEVLWLIDHWAKDLHPHTVGALPQAASHRHRAGGNAQVRDTRRHRIDAPVHRRLRRVAARHGRSCSSSMSCVEIFGRPTGRSSAIDLPCRIELLLPQLMPQVSVIMNVRNGASFLREALDSVLAQTFAGLGTDRVGRLLHRRQREDHCRVSRSANSLLPVAGRHAA